MIMPHAVCQSLKLKKKNNKSIVLLFGKQMTAMAERLEYTYSRPKQSVACCLLLKLHVYI